MRVQSRVLNRTDALDWAYNTTSDTLRILRDGRAAYGTTAWLVLTKMALDRDLKGNTGRDGLNKGTNALFRHGFPVAP